MTGTFTQEQSAATPPTITGSVSLIVTFYGPLNKLNQLTSVLCRYFDLKPFASIDKTWLYPADSTLPERVLQQFEPPAARDTSIVQLLLNGEGEVKKYGKT